MITNCGYTGEIEITDSINNEKSKNDKIGRAHV